MDSKPSTPALTPEAQIAIEKHLREIMLRYVTVGGILGGILAVVFFGWIDSVARSNSQAAATKALESQQNLINETFKVTFSGIHDAQTKVGKLQQEFDTSLEKARQQFQASLDSSFLKKYTIEV
jgi:hypothetical protein